jgi:preprotein translocase subunit SecY
MNSLIQKLRLAFSDASLRSRILFTLGALVIFRFLATIPVPGVDVTRLEQFFSNNQFFGLLNVFSGGGFSNLSIVMLGVSPFITASIILQLLTIMIPRLKQLYQEEGEAGRQKFAYYGRLLSVPLAAIQGFAFMALLARQGILPTLTGFDLGVTLITIIAGSVLLMWIGELISEFGVGNGVSLIIFAGIVASLPQQIRQLAFTFDPSQIPLLIGFILLGIAVIAAVVIITEAERPIPINYAKRVRGMKVYGGVSTYLPLRVNQAGVMPIIFALSILLFPQMIFNFLSSVDNATVKAVSTSVLSFLNNPWLYAGAYFFLVVLFTYFYTAIIFEPHTIATNLQKSGAFIPGVRPGTSTSDYLSRILVRLTLVGALFLGVIAVLPLGMRAATGQAALAIGGTSLLIAVSVALDLAKKVDAQVTMREY